MAFNRGTLTTSLADVIYDGSGGEYLARLLECLHATLNTAPQSLVGGLAGTYTMDLSLDAVTTLQSNNFKGLSLKIATRLDPQVAVTFMDANLVNGLVTRIFNIPLGCLT